MTVCSEDHRFIVGEQLQAIGIESGGILLEPVARNAAPAIIPLGSVHRSRNRGNVPVEPVEVRSGSYLGEDDTVRLKDMHGRK